MSDDGLRQRLAVIDIDELDTLLGEVRARLMPIGGSTDTALIAEVYRGRRLRDACFGSDGFVFGEPAWDILLDLYLARTAGRRICVSSACIAACAPPTTALRHLAVLETRGLVERLDDTRDRRQRLVALSDKGKALMDAWQARMGARAA